MSINILKKSSIVFALIVNAFALSWVFQYVCLGKPNYLVINFVFVLAMVFFSKARLSLNIFGLLLALALPGAKVIGSGIVQNAVVEVIFGTSVDEIIGFHSVLPSKLLLTALAVFCFFLAYVVFNKRLNTDFSKKGRIGVYALLLISLPFFTYKSYEIFAPRVNDIIDAYKFITDKSAPKAPEWVIKEQKPSAYDTYVVVIGDSGKGKNNVTDLHNLMTEKTLQEHDRKEYEKCDANAEEREKKKNAKDCPPKYHPKLRLIETASSTSILDLQANLGENGMLLGHFSEADAFGVAGGTSTKLLSTLIRKGWSGEIHTQYYMSDCSRNVMARMCISLLVCGTVNSVVGGMLSGKNTENGLMQRFIPVVVPKAKRTFRPPICNRLTQEEKDELQGMIVQLYTKDLALGDSTLTLDMPLTRKMIGKWFDDLEVRYNNGEITEAEADLSARVGEHMMRAAIPLVALEGKESKEMLEFIKWVGDIAYYNLCWIFGHSVQKNLEEAKEMMGSHKDLRKTAEPILDKLPNVFTLQQMKDLRRELGQSENCNMLLKRYVESGKLKHLDRGVYQKIGPSPVTT